jgi:hypothetical protein
MKQDEIKENTKYLMRYNGRNIEVLVIKKVENYPGRYARNSRKTTHWEVKNLGTGRVLHVRSALKFIKEI